MPRIPRDKHDDLCDHEIDEIFDELLRQGLVRWDDKINIDGFNAEGRLQVTVVHPSRGTGVSPVHTPSGTGLRCPSSKAKCNYDGCFEDGWCRLTGEAVD